MRKTASLFTPCCTTVYRQKRLNFGPAEQLKFLSKELTHPPGYAKLTVLEKFSQKEACVVCVTTK